jgi:hypothetical protein
MRHCCSRPTLIGHNWHWGLAREAGTIVVGTDNRQSLLLRISGHDHGSDVAVILDNAYIPKQPQFHCNFSSLAGSISTRPSGMMVIATEHAAAIWARRSIRMFRPISGDSLPATHS